LLFSPSTPPNFGSPFEACFLYPLFLTKNII
jgi:hypothetical protein